MSLQNIKERKVGSHTKYYQKHLNLFGINRFNFKQIVTFFFFCFLLLLLLFIFLQKHVMAQREEELNGNRQT